MNISPGPGGGVVDLFVVLSGPADGVVSGLGEVNLDAVEVSPVAPSVLSVVLPSIVGDVSFGGVEVGMGVLSGDTSGYGIINLISYESYCNCLFCEVG